MCVLEGLWGFFGVSLLPPHKGGEHSWSPTRQRHCGVQRGDAGEAQCAGGGCQLLALSPLAHWAPSGPATTPVSGGHLRVTSPQRRAACAPQHLPSGREGTGGGDTQHRWEPAFLPPAPCTGECRTLVFFVFFFFFVSVFLILIIIIASNIYPAYLKCSIKTECPSEPGCRMCLWGCAERGGEPGDKDVVWPCPLGAGRMNQPCHSAPKSVCLNWGSFGEIPISVWG